MFRILVAALFALIAAHAQAGIIVTTAQVGPSVVFSFSGTLDLAGTTPISSSNTSELITPSSGGVLFGIRNGLDSYTGIPDFPAFGTTAVHNGTGSGDTLQLYTANGIGVPGGYSGGFISGALSVPGTFASLGLTDGVYTRTLPSLDTVQMTIDSNAVVPVPATLPVLAALVGFAGWRMHRRAG